MAKGKKSALAELDSEQTKKLFIGVGLVGAGLLTAAAIGLMLIKKKELEEPDDFYAMLGIGA